MVPIIISKFHFFQVQRKLFFRYAMELGQTLFGITPKSFQTVNIDFTAGKSLAMIHSQMAIPATHQGVITPELVRVNNRATPDSSDRHLQQTAGRDIVDDLHSDYAISLQNAKYRHFTGRSAAAFTLASAAKVAFIQFNLTAHKVLSVLRRNQHGVTQQIISFQRRGITHATLNRRPKGADFQFKQLDQPQPGFKRAMQLVDPSAGKIMKGIMTPSAAILSVGNAIDFIASTLCAKNMAFLPAVFSKIKTCFIFRKYNSLKLLRLHLHQYNIHFLVQKAL